MTVNMSGFAAAQARVNQIQAMFGQQAGQVATLPSAPTAGAFRDALVKADATAPAPVATGNAQAQARSTSTPHAAPSRTERATTPLDVPTSRGKRAAAAPQNDAPAPTVGGLKNADAVLATAKKYLGIPYLWGGTNPAKGLDCSGFVQLVLKQHGITMPRVSRDQAREGKRVESLADARPGDLVAFGSPVHHIGIYVGDGKMIHAPKTGDVVKISKVHKDLTAIRRVLPEESAGAATVAPASRPLDASTNDALTAATTPTAGLDTRRLAATLRAAAVNPALGEDPTTWKEAVATAVAQSLQSSGADDVQQVVASAVSGLGGVTPSLMTSIEQAKNAQAMSAAASTTAAAPAAGASRPANSLAPEAVGTGPLNEAPAAYRAMFLAAERKYGVPATLLAAVAKRESDFNPRVVSGAGAQGLMQLMPGTQRALGVTDPFDPAQSIDGGARELRGYLRQFKTLELALAAYNAGPGNVRKYDGIPPFKETQNYVRRIMSDLRGTAA